MKQSYLSYLIELLSMYGDSDQELIQIATGKYKLRKWRLLKR